MDDLQYYEDDDGYDCSYSICFKPCYKWMTFNTLLAVAILINAFKVLNLVINGWPSILKRIWKKTIRKILMVLNLVINGWPSILVNIPVVK